MERIIEEKKIEKNILDRFIQYCFSQSSNEGTSNEGTHVVQISHPNKDPRKRSVQLALHIKIRSSVFPESDKEEIIYSEIKIYKENSDRSLHIQLGKLRRELIKKLIDKYIAELFNRRKVPLLSTRKFFSLHTLKKTDVIKSEILNMFRMALEDVELFERKALYRKESILIAKFIMKAFEEYANSHKENTDSKEFVLVNESDVAYLSGYFSSRYEYMIKMLNESRMIHKTEKKKDNRIALPSGMSQKKKDISSGGSLLQKIMNVGFIHAGVNHV